MASPPRKGFGNDASSRGGKLDIPPGLLDTLSKLAAGGKVGPEGLSPVRVGPSSSYRASPDRSLQSSTLGSSSKAAGGTPPAGARDPNQLLHATLKACPNMPAVKRLMAMGADVNSRNPAENSATPLHILAASAPGTVSAQAPEVFTQALCGPTPPQVPLLQLLQLLVDAGADVAAQDALGRTPLQVAIETGNTPCVGFLALRAKALPRTPDVDNQLAPTSDIANPSLIKLAIKHKHWAALPLLIQAGAPWPHNIQLPDWYTAFSKECKTHGLRSLQDLLLLQLQTALLGWEAQQAGQEGKAAAFQHYMDLLSVAPSLVEALVRKAAAGGSQLLSGEKQHIQTVMSHTRGLVKTYDKLEQLLGLLAAQQPTIFRGAAGQGQRAAVLQPLLACLHLQYVVDSLLQVGDRGYAMHKAVVDAGAAQLRVLQALGADLNLLYMDNQMGVPVPSMPMVVACAACPGVGDCGSAPWLQPGQEPPMMLGITTGKNREAYMRGKDGNYSELVQRRVGVVKVLVEAGASLLFNLGPMAKSALTLAAFSGLYPVLECVLRPTLAALGDESAVAPHMRELSLAIQKAACGGNMRCLQLLLGPAARGPAFDEAKAALCTMVASLDLDSTKILLRAGVPVNGLLQGVTAPLHMLMNQRHNGRLEAERAMFDLLLSKGADINQPGECGRTPLLVAVLAANREKAQWLIDAGADMSVMDDVGRNLLEHACLTGDWNLVTWALQIGCWLSPKGAQGLVSALQQSKLGASFKDNQLAARVKLLLQKYEKGSPTSAAAGGVAQAAQEVHSPARGIPVSPQKGKRQQRGTNSGSTADTTAAAEARAAAVAAELLAAEEATKAAAAAKAAKKAEKKKRQAAAKAAAAGVAPPQGLPAAVSPVAAAGGSPGMDGSRDGVAAAPHSSSPSQRETMTVTVAAGAAPLATDAGSGAQQDVGGAEEGECVVCLSARSRVLMLPCRHMCCCSQCWLTLQAKSSACPLCRQEVKEHIEAFV